MDAEIRPEQERDKPQVRLINEQAFGRPDEARLVDALRRVQNVVSLVAEVAGEVVGHILFTPARAGRARNVMALGPMAVAPDFQRRGIGSALVRSGLDRCRESGAELVFVLGHVDYYPRFGFQSAWKYGFFFLEPADQPAFMVLELEPGAAAGNAGQVRYRPEFEGMD